MPAKVTFLLLLLLLLLSTLGSSFSFHQAGKYPLRAGYEIQAFFSAVGGVRQDVIGRDRRPAVSTATASSSLFTSSSSSRNVRLSETIPITMTTTRDDTTTTTTKTTNNTNNYWNREMSASGLVSTSDDTRKIVRPAKIISLSDPEDDANAPLHTGELPPGSSLLAVGTRFEDFDIESLQKLEPNVLFVSHPMARDNLAKLLDVLPSLTWVHTRSAGIDFVTSPALAASPIQMTNAKGQFSSTLAEYTMMACAYFAKDLPRLRRQQTAKRWEKYSVQEIRGATLGIVGYGDIGRACARLAKAYGMKVVAQRRHVKLCDNDPLCDVVYGAQDLNKLVSESDYVVVAAPLTDETRGMVGRDAFDHAKENAVFINVGRGPIVNQDELIHALESGKLKGAALDVFTMEPLPETSKLWEMDNVLISPHNMDQTETFMHESTEFFVNENLPRFICGEELLNPVDKTLGY